MISIEESPQLWAPLQTEPLTANVTPFEVVDTDWSLGMDNIHRPKKGHSLTIIILLFTVPDLFGTHAFYSFI